MTDILIRKTLKGQNFDSSQLSKGQIGSVIEYSIDDHAGSVILQYLNNSPAANVLFIDDVVLSQLNDITAITNILLSQNTVYNLSVPGIDQILVSMSWAGRVLSPRAVALSPPNTWQLIKSRQIIKQQNSSLFPRATGTKFNQNH
jgi:hypothetical protein